jgi:hypothetical protein
MAIVDVADVDRDFGREGEGFGQVDLDAGHGLQVLVGKVHFRACVVKTINQQPSLGAAPACVNGCGACSATNCLPDQQKANYTEIKAVIRPTHTMPFRALFLALLLAVIPISGWSENRVELHVFWSLSCPHCQEALPQLSALAAEHPWVICRRMKSPAPVALTR